MDSGPVSEYGACFSRNEGNEAGVTGMRPELGERGRNYG